MNTSRQKQGSLSPMTIAYEMFEDGTSQEVEVSRQTLCSEKVYCIVDDTNKNIYVWIGRNADTRKRFVGARTASQLRDQQGNGFRVRPEDEGEESNLFLSSI
jgi:hypothetical protein